MSDTSSSDPIVVERRSGGGFGLFLLGVAVGAGLALLYAPQSGEETRADLRRGARRLRRKVRDAAEGVQESAEEFTRGARRAADGFVRDARGAVGDLRQGTRDAARDAREALERRLAKHGRPADDDDDAGDHGV